MLKEQWISSNGQDASTNVPLLRISLTGRPIFGYTNQTTLNADLIQH